MNLKDYSVKLGIKLDEKSVVNLQTELDTKFKDKKINISMDSKNLEQIKDILNNIYLELGRIEKKNGFSAATKGTKEFNKELGETEKKIKNANFATGNWAYNWSKAMQSFLTYNTVTQLYNQIVNGIKDMINNVKELDDALVELQKVTDLEGESLRQFTNDAFKAGEAVAKTGTEMIEAATAFAKAGYKDSSLELGTVAAMYTNIADEEINAADAADMIIAQMKAFNIEAEDSMHIIDAINEVSNNFAVSSADIARNLGKASAVMANAGNSMEQYIGLMTAATEITRNASKAANGLKTLTLRLQGMNDEGERDLEVQSQIEALFQKLGISVYKANGELKNTYEILETLVPVYQKLTNAEKAYVTETIAGKYQAQNAAAILNNWQTAVDATTTAMNSNGSAAKENEKVLASIQGRLQRLKSAWENLSRSVINSDFIKFIVDLGTVILKVANNDVVKLIAKIEGLSLIFKLLAASGIGKTITAFYSLAVSEGVAATSTLTLQSIMMILNKTLIGKLLISFASYIKYLYTVAATQGVLTASTTALSGAFGLLAAHPVVATLTAIIGVAAIAKQRFDALRSEVKDLQEELDGIESSKNRLTEIQDAFAEGNLSIEEQANLFAEIRDIQKELKDKYDINTKAISKGTEAVEDQIDKLKELLELEEQRDYEKLLEDTEELGAGKSFSEWLFSPGDWFSGVTKSGQKKIEKEVEEYRKNLVKYAKGANKDIADAFNDFDKLLEDEDVTREKISEYYSKLLSSIYDSKLSDEVKGYLIVEAGNLNENFKEALQDITDVNEVKKAIKGNFKGIITKLIEGTDSEPSEGIKVHLQSALEKGLDSTWFREQIRKISNEQGFADINLIKELGLDTSLNEEGTWDYLNGLITMSNSLGIPLENLLDILIKIYPELSSVSDATRIARDEFSTLGEELNNIQDAYNACCDALDEYNEKGYFSVDTLNELLTKYPQYLDALIDENGQIRDNTDMFQALAEAKLNDMQTSEDIRHYNELMRLAQMSEAQASQLAAASLDEHNKAMAGQELNFQKFRSQIEQNIKAFNEESAAALKAAYDTENALHKRNTTLIDKTKLGIQTNFSGSFRTSSASSSRSSSPKSTKTEKEWWEKAFDDLKNQYDYSEITINQYIDGLEGLLSKLDKGSDAWKKINKELQKQRLDKIKDDYDDGRISLNQYIISLQNLQKAYKEGTAEWNKLADAIKKAKLDKLKEQQNDLKSALSAVNNTLGKQIDLQEELKDKAIDNVEKQIDAQEKLKENYEKDDDRYQRVQKAVLDFLNEQLDSINNQKDDVENYYDTVIDSLNKVNEEQQEAIDLAQAYENLMNAMTNKSKKVYREGLGWVWETDKKAIEDAKKTYDDLVHSATVKDIENQKDATLNSLDEQIQSLNDYITSWDNVFNKFENEKNRNFADLLLGENWTEMVSQLDPQIVDDFSNAYYDLQKNLEETENEIERLNELKEAEEEKWNNIIDSLKNYKEEWSDVADIYDQQQDKLKASQIIGANWEKDILDKRLDVLENFKNKYNLILSEIDKVNNMSTNSASGYSEIRLPGYAKGGEVDFTGLAMLHGTPDKPEYVLNNRQMRNVIGNMIKPNYKSNINNSRNSTVNNYNFGNIELPNVRNAQQFVNELNSLLNITKNQ